MKGFFVRIPCRTDGDLANGDIAMSNTSKVSRPAAFLHYVVVHPWQVISLVFFITLFFASAIPDLRFQTSIYDLTIEDLPESREYDAFKKEFGCEEIILVVAKADNIFAKETFGEIEKLAETLSKIKGVRRVISLPGIRKSIDVTGNWTLDEFRSKIEPVDLLKKNILSLDGKTTAISLILDDIRDKDGIIHSIKEVIDRQKNFISLYQIGMPIVSKALADFTEQDFLRLPPVTFFLVALILFLFFRNLRGILIPAGSVAIALIWTFGLMAVTGTPLSLLTMIVPVFLIAVGTAYCMYIFPEYLSALKTAGSPREASLQCFLKLGFPTSLAVMTTTIGLGSLLLNKITAIREFALFSCAGILFMLIIMLTFLPAVMSLMPFPKTRNMSMLDREGGFFDRVLSAIIKVNLHHQKKALAFIALSTAAGIIGISRIQVETNPMGFFKENTPIATHFRDIYKDMSGSFPMNVAIESGEEDFFENPAHLKKISDLQVTLGSLKGVDKTISFCDYLKLVNFAGNQYQADFYALPEESFEIRMLINNFKAMLGEDMLKRFMNPTFSKVNIMLRTHISSSRDFIEARRQIEKHLKQSFPDNFSFTVTGMGVVISQSSQLITEGQIKSLLLTLVLVFAIMFLLFMSYKVGIIGMLPNCFPIIVSFGLMGWIGIPLSMVTSLVASIAVGLAVDDTIHYLVRYNREFKKDLNKEKALRETIRHMGKPIILTTLTISLGFSVLMFSNFKPTAIFGLVIIVTMFSALIADLILLPSLMLHVELVTIWDLLKLKLGKDPQKGIPLFNGLSKMQVYYILMAGALKTHESGKVIMRKGEVSDSMFAIISGQLKVVDIRTENEGKGENDSIRLISTLNAGDVVGEMGMIRSCERSATVITAEPTELLMINEKMIKRLQWLYPPAAQRFFFNLMTVLCDRLENITTCFLEETTTDRRTGLHTGKTFIEMLDREMSQSRRYHIPLSMIGISINNLMEIVLENGYKTEDALIADTADQLRKHFRATDTLCRFDNHYFCVLLPFTTEASGAKILQRVETVLVAHPLKYHSGTVTVSMDLRLFSYDTQSKKTAGAFVEDAIRLMKK